MVGEMSVNSTNLAWNHMLMTGRAESSAPSWRLGLHSGRQKSAKQNIKVFRHTSGGLKIISFDNLKFDHSRIIFQT